MSVIVANNASSPVPVKAISGPSGQLVLEVKRLITGVTVLATGCRGGSSAITPIAKLQQGRYRLTVACSNFFGQTDVLTNRPCLTHVMVVPYGSSITPLAVTGPNPYIATFGERFDVSVDNTSFPNTTVHCFPSSSPGSLVGDNLSGMPPLVCEAPLTFQEYYADLFNTSEGLTVSKATQEFEIPWSRSPLSFTLLMSVLGFTSTPGTTASFHVVLEKL